MTSGDRLVRGDGRLRAVWVTNTGELRSTDNGSVQRVDPKTNQVVRRFGPARGSGAVRAGGGKVWVSAHDVRTVWVLDPRR